MRVLFHGLLGFSITVAATGMICGIVAQGRAGQVGTVLHGAHYREIEERSPASRTIAPPLQVLPRFGEAVSPGATLAWHLEDGTDGADVELSPTPDFDAERTRQIEVDGETLKLPQGLASGIWYWRLRGRQGDLLGERTTATWMLDVVVAPPSDGSWG